MDIVDLRKVPDTTLMLAEWHHGQWAYLNPKSTLDDRLEETKRHLCDEPIPSTFVAIESGEVLGSAAIVEHDMDTRMAYSPWLASVFVAPEHRGIGIGSKLVSYIMSFAKKNEADTLYLFTPDKEQFYRRLGWCTIHIEPFNEVQVFVMQYEFQS
jgi:N-acetylglutamate synthase-like GNAT family acetyltransferase